MYSYAYYALEFAAILVGVVLIHKFVFNRKKKYDSGSFYLSALAAIYLWIVAVAMDMMGIELGFVLGVVGGAMAVMILDTTVGILYRSGY